MHPVFPCHFPHRFPSHFSFNPPPSSSKVALRHRGTSQGAMLRQRGAHGSPKPRRGRRQQCHGARARRWGAPCGAGEGGWGATSEVAMLGSQGPGKSHLMWTTKIYSLIAGSTNQSCRLIQETCINWKEHQQEFGLYNHIQGNPKNMGI